MNTVYFNMLCSLVFKLIVLVSIVDNSNCISLFSWSSLESSSSSTNAKMFAGPSIRYDIFSQANVSIDTWSASSLRSHHCRTPNTDWEQGATVETALLLSWLVIIESEKFARHIMKNIKESKIYSILELYRCTVKQRISGRNMLLNMSYHGTNKL